MLSLTVYRNARVALYSVSTKKLIGSVKNKAGQDVMLAFDLTPDVIAIRANLLPTPIPDVCPESFIERHAEKYGTEA